MFKYLKQVIGANALLRLTSYNAMAVFVRIVTGLITSKLIAFYLGPQGMALLGELRNFLSSVQSVCTLGFLDGVVKYVSEFRTNKKELKKILSTAYYVGFIGAILTGFTLYIGASYWNTLIFKNDYDFTYVFEIMAFSVPLYALNMFCIAILNGFAKYKIIIQLNIATNLIGVFITAALIIFFNIDGAFLAAILVPAIALVLTIILIINRKNFIKYIKTEKISKAYIIKYSSYMAMTVFSSMVSPWVYIAIRRRIIDIDGIENAGLWDAMLRLSDYYLMFVTTILTLYILPKLSRLQTDIAFRREIFNYYKTILPLFAGGLIVIYFLRGFIINLLFTPDFLAMKSIFIWHLLGDLIRVASIVLGYQFIAKNMLKHFIITQIISLSVIYFSSIYFIDQYGFVGASMGHAFSFAFHLLMMLFIFRKQLFFKLQPE